MKGKKTELNVVNGDNTVPGSKVEFDIGIGEPGKPDQENRYFTRLGWASDSSWFAMTWSSRAATQSKTISCKVTPTIVCEQNGREDGGVNGNWVTGQYFKYENSILR